MELKERLDQEIEEYNTLIEQLAELERQKLHKMGRITILQELLNAEEKPVTLASVPDRADKS